MNFVIAYVCTLIVFLAVDSLWLGLVARGFYASQLGGLMRDNIAFWAAGGFYLAYVAGIVLLAVMPALAEGSWVRAAVNGTVLGLVAYGTYDMTNLATLKGWPVTVSIVDMGWGAILTSMSAIVGFLGTRALA